MPDPTRQAATRPPAADDVSLLIVGSGGFGRETAQAVLRARASGGPLRLLGFLDDNPALAGGEVAGTPVLGGGDMAHALEPAQVVLCVGSARDPLSRMRLAARLALPEERFATVVHPSVEASADSTIGPGSVLLAHSVLTAEVRIGAHVAVMPRVVFTHDNVIEDFVTITSGVGLAGGVHVERGAYLGAGALVREYVRIGAGSVVGMGSVVLHDIPPGQVWAGNPARYLRTLAFSEAEPFPGSHRGGS